jgi:coenzyme PQQ synthesis protein D (PqqD)
MDQASVVVQHSDDRRSFVTREIGGETLIVPVTGHVMDLESIYVLNPVASRIWGLLRSPITTGRLADVIADEFEVSPQDASRDVAEFLDSLSTRGLIQELPQGE